MNLRSERSLSSITSTELTCLSLIFMASSCALEEDPIVSNLLTIISLILVSE
jgi:hypothetical protein